MNIHIDGTDIDMSDEVRANVEQRLSLALSRFSSRIARVTAKFADVSNPDKNHKKCRVEVLLRPARKIVVEDTDTDLLVAIDKAALQMARSVERKLRRDRELDSSNT
ncbi:MAG: ribosome-associated translation inhibitor RaiA [Myxococcales bacterium]|nr:MAG: ribosome-associated translation inhibitor RaiA [Myxococcales bacterium]